MEDTYNYDPDRRLGSVTQGSQHLGQLSIRQPGSPVSKPPRPAQTDYDLQGHLLEESGPALAATYVYLDDEPLARMDYNLSDTTGNINAWNITTRRQHRVSTPIQPADHVGNVSWTGQLDPYGNVLPINPGVTHKTLHFFSGAVLRCRNRLALQRPALLRPTEWAVLAV